MKYIKIKPIKIKPIDLLPKTKKIKKKVEKDNKKKIKKDKTKNKKADNEEKEKKVKKKNRSIPKVWKEKIVKRQKFKCAWKGCKKPITIYGNFDHRIPLAMGGTHEQKNYLNIQCLCAEHHEIKTRRDRDDIKEWKKKQKDKK